MSKVKTSASFQTVPLGLEVVCITTATTVLKFDTFVLLEKRMINIEQQMDGDNFFFKYNYYLGFGFPNFFKLCYLGVVAKKSLWNIETL